MKISLPEHKKVYFASDFHLGAPNKQASKQREQHIIEWLNAIEEDAAYIFLMGDVFDFWFEYKTVVPKGFVRFLGKLAQLRDSGIEITLFTGNHDMWMFGYLEEEIGVNVYRHPKTYQIANHSFYLAHGDGLGPGDSVYKTLKVIFEHRFFRWLFRNVHPDFGMWVAQTWSSKSRHTQSEEEQTFLGEEEWLWQYAKEIQQQTPHDFYVFGHRHLPLNLEVTKNSRYINLGEWISHFTFAVYDGNSLQLERFSKR